MIILIMSVSYDYFIFLVLVYGTRLESCLFHTVVYLVNVSVRGFFDDLKNVVFLIS